MNRRHGLSLMEVILALAIFAMAITFIGELVRLGSRGAAGARDLATAQLLCESKLAEVSAGIILPEPIVETPFEDPTDWLYTIEIESTNQDGLLSVRVTVQQDLPAENRPLQFSLTRWIVDPAFIEALEAEAAGCCCACG